MNYKITLAFDGSGFSGWQFQKNAPTVQGELTETAKRFFSEEVSVTGCSRTDSGVHAENYVCSIKASAVIPPDAVMRGMNSLLPSSIVVKCAEVAEDSFHPRYDCKCKEYRYRILNTQNRDPFLRNRVWHISNPLDVDKMREDARAFLGRHDFSAFMATGSKIEDATRTVFSAGVEREGEVITFFVSADGFLYNMVRIMAGTLVDSALGRLKNTVPEIIEEKKRALAGVTAPPEGLYLYRAEY